MTVLQRTDLTTSQKIQCAAAAVAGQHAHGSKTALSETYEISRPTVYAVAAAAQSVLRSHFEAPLLQGAAVDVRVDDAQLPQPRQQCQQGVVTTPGGPAPVTASQQPRHIGSVEDRLRRSQISLGRAWDRVDERLLDVAAHIQESHQGTQCGGHVVEPADTAPFGLAEHEGAQRRWLQTPRFEALFLGALEQEGPDVPPVADDGERRETPLHSQIVGERIEHLRARCRSRRRRRRRSDSQSAQIAQQWAQPSRGQAPDLSTGTPSRQITLHALGCQIPRVQSLPFQPATQMRRQVQHGHGRKGE